MLKITRLTAADSAAGKIYGCCTVARPGYRQIMNSMQKAEPMA
ncbi:hypothetical protein [Paenibacillus sp. P3E]|nr:hypothetical protein [Paenibacillus sp. P3E]